MILGIAEEERSGDENGSDGGDDDERGSGDDERGSDDGRRGDNDDGPGGDNDDGPGGDGERGAESGAHFDEHAHDPVKQDPSWAEGRLFAEVIVDPGVEEGAALVSRATSDVIKPSAVPLASPAIALGDVGRNGQSRTPKLLRRARASGRDVDEQSFRERHKCARRSIHIQVLVIQRGPSRPIGGLAVRAHEHGPLAGHRLLK